MAENDVIKIGIIAEPGISEYLDPEQSQPGTSKIQSESIFDMEKLKSIPYITDKGNFKELSNQVKWFVIESEHYCFKYAYCELCWLFANSASKKIYKMFESKNMTIGNILCMP